MGKLERRAVEVDPVEAALGDALELADEKSLDASWQQTTELLRGYLQRPAKRVRPALLVAGYRAAKGEGAVPEGVYRFAAGLELLHAFMLVHDDVADRATVRRGGPALHVALAPDGSAEGTRLGQDLAVIAGDHLFARAVETMLCSGAPNAAEATQYLLAVCRHTAIGQALDLRLAHAPLGAVTLFETMRVAQLKTARYGFVAPLVLGAMLGGASEALKDALGRAGRHAGIAFQLRDDLLGLFGDDVVAGKSCAADYLEGKRTFPVIAAWARADQPGRDALESLWAVEAKGPAECEQARALLERLGGRAATERVIDRCTRAALKSLAAVPPGKGRSMLMQLVAKLEHRAA